MHTLRVVASCRCLFCEVEETVTDTLSYGDQVRQQESGPTESIPAAVLALAIGVYYHECWVSPQVLSHLILELVCSVETQNFFPSPIVPYWVFLTKTRKLKIIFPDFLFN